ncbi:TPA: FecR domain-containing protein [Stenotrophomonas maltophilia]|uniref:FecR family protein n=1 Tax=Stenotrophomonas maltophilia TaxID=40324 RepID=UPI0010A9A2D9|nr:FecR domain-containing protein [Stenotrophomonas maltophilia]TIE15695.1 iron dicitrate transport regulator FecR [Stenotrophomonas maltophilia]TIE54142.1 iron dicitrate transport regulator FecR [Stenotrophomonas maltophilia]
MSPPNTLPAANDDALAEQARGWIAWLASGDISDARMRDFECWLALPGHRRAFEHERVLWRSAGPRPPQAATIVRRRPQRLRWAMAAAAALAMLVVWPEAWLRAQADHRSTHVVKNVQLPDGSRAVLDADSAIAVRFDANARQIELLRGRAWFEVSPDAQRRFSVRAGNGVVEDISTAFTVARGDDRVETQVGQGRVRVASPADGGWTYLQVGQRAVYGERSGVTRLDDVAADSVGAWRQGELLLEQASVADAVRGVGRYRAGPTFVRGDLSRLPAVSAALRIDRPEQALDALAATAGLQVTRLPLGVAIVHQ